MPILFAKPKTKVAYLSTSKVAISSLRRPSLEYASTVALWQTGREALKNAC